METRSVIHEANAGPSLEKSRNKAALGESVALEDSDNLMDAREIGREVAIFGGRNSVVCCLCDAIVQEGERLTSYGL